MFIFHASRLAAELLPLAYAIIKLIWLTLTRCSYRSPQSLIAGVRGSRSVKAFTMKFDKPNNITGLTRFDIVH